MRISGGTCGSKSESFLDHSLNIAFESLDLFVIDAAKIGQDLHFCFQIRLFARPFDDLKTAHSLHDQLHDAFVAHHSLDIHDRTDLVEISRT